MKVLFFVLCMIIVFLCPHTVNCLSSIRQETPCRLSLVSNNNGQQSCGLQSACDLVAWVPASGQVILEGTFNGTLQVLRTSYPHSIEYIEFEAYSSVLTNFELIHFLPLISGHYRNDGTYQTLPVFGTYMQLNRDCRDYRNQIMYNSEFTYSPFAPPWLSSLSSLNRILSVTLLSSLYRPNAQAYWFVSLAQNVATQIVYDCTTNSTAVPARLKRVSAWIPSSPYNTPISQSEPYWVALDPECDVRSWQDVFSVAINSE